MILPWGWGWHWAGSAGAWHDWKTKWWGLWYVTCLWVWSLRVSEGRGLRAVQVKEEAAGWLKLLQVQHVAATQLDLLLTSI